MVNARKTTGEVFVEFTKSICPVCKCVVDAQINIRDGKVYLRKRCREHGEFEAVVYGDAEMYIESTRFNKPGTIPLRAQMSGVPVADVVPNAVPLQPLLSTSPHGSKFAADRTAVRE